MSADSLYGVKIILKSIVEDCEEVFFEEMVLAIETDSEDDAIEKAKKYAKGYCQDYLNGNGKKVTTDIFEISNVFEAFEAEDGVREVYSHYITFYNNFGL